MQRECILVTSVQSCCCHLVILIASHIFVLCRTKYCLLDCLLLSPCKGDVSFFSLLFLFLWHNGDPVICVLVLLLLRSHCRFVSCLSDFLLLHFFGSLLETIFCEVRIHCLTALILHFMHLFKTLIYESLYTPTPL